MIYAQYDNFYGRLIHVQSSSDYYNNQLIKLLLHTHQPYHNSCNHMHHQHFLLPSSHIMVHFSPLVLVTAYNKKDKQYFPSF